MEGEKPIISQERFMSSLSIKVGQVAFPAGFGEVFATRSFDEIRIWNVADQRELLCIKMSEADGSLPSCNCLEFMADGKSIMTGWTDGRIRAYLPQSGQLFYLIKDGHRGNNPTALSPGGVTCLSTALNCQ